MARLHHDDQVPSGRSMYAHSRRERSLDSIIHKTAVKAISTYCQSVGIAGTEMRVHKVPPGARTREQILAWFKSIPGISITVFPEVVS